jgi:tetratricopeptide (TPR) repeat protein
MDILLYLLIFAAVIFIVVFGLMNILKDKSNLVEKARRFVESGNYDDAIEIYNKLILHEEFNPVYHTLLADVYFINENYQRAVVEYEIALKNSKDLPPGGDVPINRNLGISYFKLKNYPKAFLALFSAYLVNESDAEVCMYIALVYASQRKFKKAFDYINKAESVNPMNYDIHYYAGLIATQLGKKETAIREFTFAKRFRQNNFLLDLYIGALYKEIRDFMSAIRFLKTASRALTDMEQKMKTFLLLGECYKGIGLIEDAVTSLEMASQENFDSSDAKAFEWKKNVLYNLGMAYAKDGNKEKAMAAWQNLKQMDFFYKDIKELTSQQVTDETLNFISERWMVMPVITLNEVIPVNSLVSKKFFDIDTLEKTVEQNLSSPKPQQGSLIERYKKLNLKRFREVSRKALKFMGFSIQKEISLSYDSDFKEGKAIGFVGSKGPKRYLIIIKRYEENVTGMILLNAVGSAKSMGIPNVVVIITSRFNDDAVSVSRKYANLTIIDRRGLVKALKFALG